MAVYRFRVSFEEYDEVYRDIEIRSVQSFETFHKCIQEAIGFDASKPTSFYMSNDLWKKGQEITMDDAAKNSDGKKLPMSEARLCDFIADPHQKIYYVFDQPSQWTFYIELIKILPDGDGLKKYPVCVKTWGEAPKQYLKIETPKGGADEEFLEDSIFEEVLAEEEVEEEDPSVVAEEDSDFSEEVDEEEYDNIEESSEEETEND